MTRQESTDNSLSPWQRHLPIIHTRTLNAQQKTAYDIISSHYMQLTEDGNSPPLRMMVCGTAGTGKSYLISAIAHTLAVHAC